MAMASSKFMPSTSSSSSPNSDLISHHHHHPILPDFQPPPPPPPDPNHLLHATDISLIDAAGAIDDGKTVDDVWREIVGGKNNESVECKVEAGDEMMTLEDFLAKAGAGEEDADDVGEDHVEDVKVFGGYDCGSNGSQMMMMYGPGGPGGVPVGGVMGYGNGGGSGGMEHLMGGGVRGKRRGGPILEPLDKAAQQRQRRMIKNRESAARSRERKQAYQVELESLASKLEEENEQLLREKAEQSKERFKQLMEKVIPVVEKKRPPRALRRVRSMQW